jgi:tRNA A-37 threonylcarbamoyl transferase component Bud32
MTMDVNGKEFEVIRLLGKGKGGYSYLVTDGSKSYVLKQIHHEPCDYYQFGDKLASELNDYRRLLEVGIPLPRMIDVDEKQERILKEYIDGPTIYQLVLADGVQQWHVDQMRQMCGILYPNGLNIDYFPTNFVVQDGKLYYIDYECNGYMEQWNFENWGISYWSKTPQFLQYAKEHGDL